jgi:phage tail-like protein
MARIDPLRNFRYRLEIDNITQAGFSEVAIAETTIDAVDYREGTDPPHVRKLSASQYGNHAQVGLTVGGAALDLWHAMSAGRQDRRKKVVIVVQDRPAPMRRPSS